MSQELTKALKGYILDAGADLVGFGSVDRLEGAPEIQRPQRYLPDASSMISIALHINEAACDLIARNTRSNTVPPSYHSFQLYTLVMINRKLDEIAYQCAKFLEDRGYKAYPFPVGYKKSYLFRFCSSAPQKIRLPFDNSSKDHQENLFGQYS